MKLPKSAYTDPPWRMHEIAPEFTSKTSGPCRHRAARMTFPGSSS
ncbi:hypothetical protein EV652_110147 [Kribbella steppae]|uniref:Uncharacterized protein n=1 Tax=Kribbella steppae TaxID=2512223 RepID=A0A4V2RYV6_9ACTN|nr:hypothetical protein EV652_110147 [Kribbella steppae]